jgi:Peptidase of plants and bacteria
VRRFPSTWVSIRSIARRVGTVASIALVSACGSNPDVLYVGTAPPPFDPVCTPVVEVQNLDQTGGGLRVFNDVALDPIPYVRGLTRQICPVLFRRTAEVPDVPKITIVIRNISTPFTAVTDNTTTALSASFLESYATSHTASETRYEITGILVHHLAHYYQSRGGAPLSVLQGVNEFVRYQLGYRALADRRKGGSWDDGVPTTGFFFDYIDGAYPDFVYKFNLAMANGYDIRLFQAITGKDVTTLWTDYQSSF